MVKIRIQGNKFGNCRWLRSEYRGNKFGNCRRLRSTYRGKCLETADGLDLNTWENIVNC